MTVPITVALMFGMGGGAFASPAFNPDAFGGSSSVDLMPDVRASQPMVLEYGIPDDDITNNVAPTGSLRWSFNNAVNNSAGIVGYYSPLHALKRGGFDFNIPVQLEITHNGTTYYKFRGRLADILPTPGPHADRMVRCTALDLMDDYARLPVPPLAVQFNKRGDELVQMILDALPSDLRPLQRAIETSTDTHRVALDRAREETVTIRQQLAEIAASEQATVMIVGTTAPGGGLFTYRTRQHAALNPTVLAHLEDDILAMVVPGSRDDVVSKVQVLFHPTRTGDTDQSVLFSLHSSSLLVQQRSTLTGVKGPYRDQDNPSDRVAGIDMIQPVAYTDYTMHSSPDGTGTDLTPNFVVTADYSSGTSVNYTITNNGFIFGYVTKLQSRGRGIYRYTAMVEKVVPDVPSGLKLLRVDLPYQSDANVADSMATYYTNTLSQVYGRVSSVTFLASRSSGLMALALLAEPGIRISLSESVTGFTAAEFIISGVRLEIWNAINPHVWCTWYLRPADTQRYWLLGVAGSGELGEATVLGY